MPMQKLQLAISIANLAILAMTIGITNMVILGIQLKSIKTSSMGLNSYKFDLMLRLY